MCGSRSEVFQLVFQIFFSGRNLEYFYEKIGDKCEKNQGNLKLWELFGGNKESDQFLYDLGSAVINVSEV